MRGSSTYRMSNRARSVYRGLAAAKGTVAGPVYIYRGDGEMPIPEYIVAEGRENDELQRLKRAFVAARRDLEGLIAVLKERTGRQDVRIFECHLMILEDSALADETEGYIMRGRLNAEAAVRKTAAGARAQFERMNDPYFRERVRDLDDVERRLLKALMGCERRPAIELTVPSVVVAGDLTPSETVQLPRELVLGFATDGGSPTSHVALLARALAIPAVCGLKNLASSVAPGDTVLLDGEHGVVTVAPSQEEVAAARRACDADALGASHAAAPAGTLADGSAVRICANIHPGVPFDAVKAYGARGIGLYRSEYLWLDREIEPTEDEQFEAYAAAVRLAASLEPGASATIRLLDIGGDKRVRSIRSREANPFLGNRSIRYLLSHRDVLRTQMRAVLRASAEGPARMMYPMVSCVEELDECARELAGVKSEMERRGETFDDSMPVGAMIEVPAAALLAGELAAKVDFFSIGTNDLVQYTMAADRGNEAVANLYQPLNRAVLKLVDMTVKAAKTAGIPVAVCGESAADPVAGALWVAMGVDELSMSATFIPMVSKVLAGLSREALDAYAAVPRSMPPGTTGAAIYNECRRWLDASLPGAHGLFAK